MTSEFQRLAESLYWEKVERARKLTPEERMKARPELFDYACSITLNALSEQMPGATESQLLEKIRERIAIKRQLDDACTNHHP